MTTKQSTLRLRSVKWKSGGSLRVLPDQPAVDQPGNVAPPHLSRCAPGSDALDNLPNLVPHRPQIGLACGNVIEERDLPRL